jgi:hypothetical protein
MSVFELRSKIGPIRQNIWLRASHPTTGWHSCSARLETAPKLSQSTRVDAGAVRGAGVPMAIWRLPKAFLTMFKPLARGSERVSKRIQ